MHMHECSKCELSGNCSLEPIAPWLNEHEQETNVAQDEVVEQLALVCEAATSCNPMLALQPDILVTVVNQAFAIGYCKGRLHREVPEVFKKA